MPEPFIAPDIFLYHPVHGIVASSDAVVSQAGAAIVTYRAHYLSNNLDPIVALVDELNKQQVLAVVIFVQGLREAYLVNELAEVLQGMKQHKLGVIINTTGFSVQQFDRQDASEFILCQGGFAGNTGYSCVVNL